MNGEENKLPLLLSP